ncbi:ribosomal protein S18-alanine N-acetyltransferase [Halomonas sp. M20]|uniref:ribosomal protein S18-alanine N-acetyltransferase n=1 Tax=Halomonas sp. M20 TaxID=2763264 RepID=UPI001D0A2A1D|nr:ribosomal protein S18-alanine N-acetyltransferase [Halomonas sp. M20]
MTPRLEPLTSQWLPWVIAIENAGQQHPWSRTQLQDAFEDERAILLGAFANEGLAAYAVLYRLPFEAELQAITVDPKARRRGIARALLGEVIAEAMRWGSERLLLEVRASNQAAHSLYEQQGFSVDARRRGYYAAERGMKAGQREDALLMSRCLATANGS